MINSTEVKRYNLCTSAQTTTWVEGLVDIKAFAGQTVALKFRATTDVSGVSSFVLDDVSLTEGGSSIPTETPTVTRTPMASPTPMGTPTTHTMSGRVTAAGGAALAGIRLRTVRGTAPPRMPAATTCSVVCGRQLHADGGQERLHVHAGLALSHLPPNATDLNFTATCTGSTYTVSGRVTAGGAAFRASRLRTVRDTPPPPMPAATTCSAVWRPAATRYGGQERLHVHAGFALGHAAAERHRQELHGHLHRVHLHGHGPGDGRPGAALSGVTGFGRCGTQCQHRWQRQLPAQRTGGRQLHADGGQERLHVHAGFALGHTAAERPQTILHGHLRRGATVPGARHDNAEPQSGLHNGHQGRPRGQPPPTRWTPISTSIRPTSKWLTHRAIRSTAIELNAAVFSSATINSVDNTGGQINFSASKPDSPYLTGSFTAATIRFRAKAAVTNTSRGLSYAAALDGVTSCEQGTV